MSEVAETTKVEDMYGDLITDEVNFRVETRGIHSYGEDGGMHMPEHVATIRINPDGSEAPLWVVGSKYAVVDHREVIKGFAEALDAAELDFLVDHRVFKRGCRIYSIFVLNKSYKMGSHVVYPFFTLTTSHDGSLRLGFMVGAKMGDMLLNVSKTVYGAHAKHTKGINIEKTLKQIDKALHSFCEEVIPMWEEMQSVELKEDESRKIIENAISKNIISKRRADNISLSDCNNLWNTYTKMVKEVSLVSADKRGTAEGAFDRNTAVGEYFRKLAKNDMSGLKEVMTKEFTE